MDKAEAVKELRSAIIGLIDAVETLGGVAEREHSSFGDTKKSAMDMGYYILRKTNDIAKGTAS